MKTRIVGCLLFICILFPHVRSISEARASVSPAIAIDRDNASSENLDAEMGTDEYGRPGMPFRKPFWNVWQEESTGNASPAFNPTEMVAGKSYLVVIDL